MAAESREPAADTAVLTRAMVRGNETAWRQFHDLYAGRLYRYLLVLARGSEDAAGEALQATFVRVARHIRRFDSEDVFWSWLTTLARSAAVDESRKRRRFTDFLTRWWNREKPAARPSPEEAGERLIAALDAALRNVDEEDRAVLERKYFQGMSVREIASELGLTEKAVESRLVRARRTLKAASLALLKDERLTGQRTVAR